MHPSVTQQSAVPPSGPRAEVTALEKTIAEHKASLHGGGAERVSGTPAGEAAPSAMSADAGPATRCDGVCRAGQEICTASRRICKIALELSDPIINTSCQRAERECNDASALCAQCK